MAALTHRRVGGRRVGSAAHRPAGVATADPRGDVAGSSAGDFRRLPISQQMSTGKNGDPVLAHYGEASREAQDILAATLQHAPTSAQRQAAWSRYKASTAQVRAETNSQMGVRESRSGTR